MVARQIAARLSSTPDCQIACINLPEAPVAPSGRVDDSRSCMARLARAFTDERIPWKPSLESLYYSSCLSGSLLCVAPVSNCSEEHDLPSWHCRRQQILYGGKQWSLYIQMKSIDCLSWKPLLLLVCVWELVLFVSRTNKLEAAHVPSGLVDYSIPKARDTNKLEAALFL